jgi:hypothetical protein
MAEEKDLLPIKIEPILEQVKTVVPRLMKGMGLAIDAMSKIQEVTNDDQLAEANDTLVKVRATYEKMVELRKPITAEFDAFKEHMMRYEKAIARDVKDNETSRIVGIIGAYNQAKLDAKRESEEKARKEKEKANYKVDITSRIKKNLADMVIERVRQVHSGSKDFFDKATLVDFDEKAKTFKSFKAALKKEHFDKCFATEYNRSILSDGEFIELVEQILVDESYAKWNELVVTAITPPLNEWIGKIPDIKQKLVDLKNVADDAEAKKALEAKQKAEADEQERVRKEELDKKQKESDDNIKRSSDVDKLQNEFREQAVTQQLDDAGPIKLLLKFKDEKPVKALAEILYHCFMHPKFPSIVKKNKDKTEKVDEHGFPEYVAGVEYFVDFFVKNCTVNVEGVEIKEVSRVIIRK